MKIIESKNIFYICIAIMILPLMFFISLIMDQLFNYDLLLEKIFMPLHEASGLLSALMIVGLPATVFLLILFSSDAFDIGINDNLIIDDFEIPLTVKNILFSLSCFLIFSTVTTFVIFENTL